MNAIKNVDLQDLNAKRRETCQREAEERLQALRERREEVRPAAEDVTSGRKRRCPSQREQSGDGDGANTSSI